MIKKCHNCRGKGTVTGNRRNDNPIRISKCYYCQGTGFRINVNKGDEI